MEQFIEVLFKDRQEHDTFNVFNEELQEWEKKRQASKEALDILLAKIPEECQARCDHLVAEIDEIDLNILEFKKRIYYEIGIKDGAKIMEILKQ